ncbi:MAG: DNA2/NAM7 family helicase [Fimbriimonadales bacterium]|nr:DNA2/NAM7 family helicase [Fimbriimonadales bacterium]
MSQLLTELINYYQQCLLQERRETLSILESRIEQLLIPLHEWAHDGWQSLNGLASVQQFVQAQRGRGTVAIVYAPYALTTARGTRHEPLIGVYGSISRGALRFDPADLWLSSLLSAEMDSDDLQSLRDELERAARLTPAAFRSAVDAIIEREGLPTPQPCPDVEALKRAPEGTLSALPALWIVPVESRYDRGLTRELDKLRPQVQKSFLPKLGALAYLSRPPRTEPLTLDEVLNAYANPVSPTFSQAVAIAHALKQPVSVITGPPGTGKTRIIAGLVLEQLIQGKPTLIASRINTAVDTAVAMVERLLGRGAILRTGNQEARMELAALASEVAGWKTFQGAGEVWQGDSVRETPTLVEVKAQEAVRRFHQAVGQLRRTAARVAHSDPAPLRWYQFLQRGRVARYERAWQALLREAETLTDMVARLRQRKLHQLRERLDKLIAASAGEMARLQRALQSDSRARHRVFEKLAQLGYPVALSSLTVSMNLPLEPELFDLLIIDEASTCDPASLLPLLYRARRVAIVGDPQQLPHITGNGWKLITPAPCLKDAQGQPFSAEFGASAYELMRALVGGEAHALLADHFRCPPQVISFANARFYGGNLRIHTPEAPSALQLRLIEGEQRGTRTGSRLNDAQQTAALEAIRAWAQANPDATYGIVTPYRAAADALIRAAQNDSRLSPLLETERLLIGTAHRFQGNEVDYLVFATIVGSNAAERDLRWVEQPNLFNVAITRARRELLILADAVLWARRALPLTCQLTETQVMMLDPTPQPKSELLHAIGAFLQAHQLPHHLQAIYRGYHLDIIDAHMPPRWAFNLLDAPALSQMTPLSALEAWAEAHALRRHGVELRWLEPRTWQLQLARWMAEQELRLQV